MRTEPLRNANQIGVRSRAPDRRRLCAALVLLSPCAALAISVAVAALGRWLPSAPHLVTIVVCVNSLLAACGSAAGGLLAPGDAARRVSGAVCGAVFGIITYWIVALLVTPIG